MESSVLERGIQTPVSLYFDLEPQTSADLEVVAQASIAWVQALREIAYIVDPSVELAVEIVDGDEGSLWINTILKLGEKTVRKIEKGGRKYPRLNALAKALAIVVIMTPLNVTAEEVWKKVVHEAPEAAKLDPQDKKEIIDSIVKALKPDVAAHQKRAFFSAVVRDRKVRAVGVGSTSRTKPSAVVKASAVKAFLDAPIASGDDEDTRSWVDTLDVTLVSPVLENSERSWRFLAPGMPEFGAKMKDREFLDAIEHGEIHEELRQGIEMTIVIRFTARRRRGIWKTVDRSVIEVKRPSLNRSAFAV